MDDILRPILTKGEEYTEPSQPPGSGPRKDERPTYEVTRKKLLQDVKVIKNTILKMSQEYLMDDVVINLKMRSDRSSKSDNPNAFINASNMKQIGSRKWSKIVKNKKGIEKNKIGKDIFLKISVNNIDILEELLSKHENFQTAGIVENIRSSEELYIDNHYNLLKHFNKDWKSGRVEIVLHSMSPNQQNVLNRLYSLVEANNGDSSLIKFKIYNSGPIFVSLFVSKECLEKIVPFNPIRTAHPLEIRGITENIEETNYVKLPLPPQNKIKSTIKIGIFDGGINSSIDYFKPYVNEYNLASMEKSDEYISHGTAVVSAALYGDLKQFSEEDTLPTPTICVESYRVFPLENPEDIDLYEAIDKIESIVPVRNDIKIYNLSFGPYGPIEDDYITRFTYSLDNLTKDNKCCFVISVGNDGEMNDDALKRIQAPSDAVNNIAVGSCIVNNSDIIEKAPYSCIGDGREGAKVKPDLVEFSGCKDKPMSFISGNGEYKVFGYGTSYASPVVARKLAEVLGISNISTPLTAKTLLIHTAKHPKGKHDNFLGYGVICSKTNDILSCTKNKITIIYEGTILPKSYAKLKIPFVEGLDFKGSVKIDWTISICTDINGQDSEDYTQTCIEDTCYLNENKYKMTHPIKNKTTVVNKINQGDLYEKLYSEGWKVSKNPISASSSSINYKPEQERKKNFKWDTVIKRTTGNKKYDQVKKPFIVIHGMERGQVLTNDRIHYSAAVTIEYIDCEENVYENTVTIYNKLEKAKIKSMPEIFVR